MKIYSQDIEADPDDADMAKQARERAQQPAAQPVLFVLIVPLWN